MAASQRTRPHRVLLVDADYRTSQRLAALLREDGYEVEVARDGTSAVTRLGSEPYPDTLVTELRLPGCPGDTVVRFARAQHPGVAVMVLTGYPHLVRRDALAGTQPVVLTKPLEYAHLLELLGSSRRAGGGGPLPGRASAALE